METRPSEQEVQDHVSDYYANEQYQNYGRKYHAHVIRGLVGGATGRILDVGCGTGIISELYPNLDIVGIDISPGMLRYNKGRWLQASVESIPFKDNYFDFVVCRSLLHHLPNVLKGLQEIKRVLRPGGTFTCWETNAGWLAERIRERTQHGDHFSEYHHSFTDLPSTVAEFFKVNDVRYDGYLAYPLFGFPDIHNFTHGMPWPDALFNLLMKADEWLSRSWFKRMGFAVRVTGTK